MIQRMRMSEFWDKYMRHLGDYLYGKKDWEDEFGVPCPKCAGGFERKTTLVKKYAGIPNAYYDKRYSEFDWTIYVDDEKSKTEVQKVKNIADSFISQFEKWEKHKIGLYIWNRIKGSGKTFLASCLCNELISKIGIGTRFVSASDLLEISQTEYPEERDELKRKPIKLLYECKLLVIDDLGQKITGKDWMEDVLFKILDERMNRGRLTIITSNIPIDELPFDDRLTDRLNKMCLPIELPNKSVRSQKSYEDKVELLKEVGLLKT